MAEKLPVNRCNFLWFYLEEDEVIVGKRLSGSKIGIFPDLKIVIYILEITN